MKDPRIPPAEAGGSFTPSLLGTRELSKSHQRKLVDYSLPAYSEPLLTGFVLDLTGIFD